MVAQSFASLLSQGMDPETQCSLHTSVLCGPDQIVVQDLLQNVGIQTVPVSGVLGKQASQSHRKVRDNTGQQQERSEKNNDMGPGLEQA